jgi:hypothetical protein
MKEVLASRELALKSHELRFEIERKIGEFEKVGFRNCENVRALRQQIRNIDFNVKFDKYKDEYPNYLYFTDEAFDDVVKRNKLKISTFDKYTGYIPEHCFEVILNANIRKEHLRPNEYWMNLFTGELYPYINLRKIIDVKCNEDNREEERLRWSDMELHSFTLSRDFSQLYIAAPASMIDDSKEITEPCDPIVFCYVRDGILVITFWE